MDEISLENKHKLRCWCCGHFQNARQKEQSRMDNSSADISELFREVLEFEVNEP